MKAIKIIHIYASFAVKLENCFILRKYSTVLTGQLHRWEPKTFNHFHSMKCISKSRLRKIAHFVLASNTILGAQDVKADPWRCKPQYLCMALSNVKIKPRSRPSWNRTRKLFTTRQEHGLGFTKDFPYKSVCFWKWVWNHNTEYTYLCW